MNALAQFTGRISTTPQVRARTDKRGYTVPVLCLELTADGATTAGELHVEQPFPINQFERCRAAAHRFKPGQHVTVQAPTEALCLVVREAAHIHIDKPETGATP